jgi:CheY-like chemotaxis protein
VPKKNLLLVDADPRSLRVLEISLRKAGYNIAAAQDSKTALEMLELARPDLILSDTRLPGMDGFALVDDLKRNAEWADIPVIFLSSDVSVESKVHGLERGVEDYLTKPIYIKEIIARVNLVLQRKQRMGLEERSAAKTRFTGSLADMGLVDLLQTVDNSKKSGVLYVTSDGQRAVLYFRDGALVDAELGSLRGERAVYRTLLWTEGTFEIDFRDVRREDVVQTSTQAVLMEGMRRLDEWGRLLEQMPLLDHVFEVDDEELLRRLAELPDEINTVLRQFDGKRSILQIIDRCDQDDLETLMVLSKLYFEGLIRDTGRVVDPREQATTPGELSAPPPSRASLPAEPSTGLTMAPPPEELLSAQTGNIAATVVPPREAPLTPPEGSPGRSPGRTLDYGPTPDSGARRVFARIRGRRQRRAHGGSERTLRGFRAPHVEDMEPKAAEASTLPLAPRATQEGADDGGSLAKTRRKRKRPKRLSLITSPGMLSAADLSRVHDADEPAEAEPARKARATFEAPLLDSDILVTDRPPPAPPRLVDLRDETASSTGEPGDDAVRVSTTRIVVPSSEALPQVPPRSTSAERSRRARTLREMRAVPLAPAAAPPVSAQAPAGPEAGKPDGARTAPELVAAAPPANATRSAASQPQAERARSALQAATPSSREALAGPRPAEAAKDPISTVPPSDPQALPIAGTARAVRGALVLAFVVIAGALLIRTLRPAEQTLPTATPAPAVQSAQPAQEQPPPAQQPEATQPAPPAQPSQPEEAPAMEAQADVPPQSPAEPGDPTAGDPAGDGVSALVEQARARDAQGKLRQAVSLYEQAAALDPNASEVLARLSFTYLNRGENEQASDFAARAVAIDPTSSEGWIVLGAARQALGDSRGARDAYRKCAEVGRGAYVAECRRVAR